MLYHQAKRQPTQTRFVAEMFNTCNNTQIKQPTIFASFRQILCTEHFMWFFCMINLMALMLFPLFCCPLLIAKRTDRIVTGPPDEFSGYVKMSFAQSDRTPRFVEQGKKRCKSSIECVLWISCLFQCQSFVTTLIRFVTFSISRSITREKCPLFVQHSPLITSESRECLKIERQSAAYKKGSKPETELKRSTFVFAQKDKKKTRNEWNQRHSI